MSSEQRHERAITIRFPQELADAIKRYAGDDRRSYNAEVVWILERYRAEREKHQTAAESEAKGE